MVRKTSLNTTVGNLVITCEHGGNQIPNGYRHLFRDCRALLESHRGFDAGALVMAKALAKHFEAPLVTSTISRLLVDLNRSVGHRDLHIKEVSDLSATIRHKIIDEYYQPYRSDAQNKLSEQIALWGRVLHISCHSFTNNYNGVIRKADIGLLYDPARRGERDLCSHWKAALNTITPDLTVRRNYPYFGRNDGFTSSMRKIYPPELYLGIELEMNQKNLPSPSREWAPLRKSVISALEAALTGNQS